MSNEVNMITQQLRPNGVLNEQILKLYDSIPRHEFVPSKFQEFAYVDMRIPLDHSQQMFTPQEEALLLQELQLTGSESILEVGTGSGYLTAMLSRLGKNILSVDYYNSFTTAAKSKLIQWDCGNVDLITGNATSGWIAQAPYDIVIITGAIEAITDIIKLQILPGGKLFAIVGKNPVMYGKILTLDHNDKWDEKLLFSTSTPALIDPSQAKKFVF